MNEPGRGAEREETIEVTHAASGGPGLEGTVGARPAGAGRGDFVPLVTRGGEGLPQIRGYRIEGEIGRGGMGVVYSARQSEVDRRVALKVIAPGGGPDDLARFHLESKAFASLEHPNIVPVFDVGSDGALHYFSMKYVSGGTLAQASHRFRNRPRAIAELMTRIAAGVMHAHQRGFLHRDLKPANILLDEAGVPLIADFGLAKRSGAGGQDLTRSGQIIGTPGYMAPEQATGRIHEQTTATDVYSLGAILYQLLTGRAPFEGDSLVEVLHRVVDEEPVRPALIEPEADGILEAIALKCLEKSPLDRYPTAGGLHEDLAAYLRGDDVSVVDGSAARFLRHLLRDSRHVEVMALWSRVWESHAWMTLITFLTVSGCMHFGWSLGRCGSLLVPYLVGMGWTTWRHRFRRPVAFSPVERQLAHIWVGFSTAVALALVIAWGERLFFAQWAAFVVLIAGVSFHAMSLVLGGSFYPLTLSCFLIAPLFAYSPVAATAAFGVLGGAGLYIPARRFSACRRRLEAAAATP